jgi:exodeoxyribonuclease X
MNHHVLVFDTETTGREKSTIIEAAWLSLDGVTSLGVKMDFQRYYNPAPAQIEFGAMAIHHILPHELEDCPPSSAFTLPAETEYLIGHNVDFDWEVAGKPDIRRICTLALARWLWPDLDGHSQSALYYWLNSTSRRALEDARETIKGAHSALVDVRMCLDILGSEVYELRGRGHAIDTWEQLWQLSEIARVPTVITFGKHKGEKIRDLPGSYVAWLLKQPDLDPYLFKALTNNVLR